MAHRDKWGKRSQKPIASRCPPEAQADQAQQVTILLHKPMGYVSGLPEDGHESAATLIGPQSQWAEDPTRTRFQARFTRGLAPAGRLDIDSTGLIVFTQNGIIARTLIGENSNIEKEYLVRVHWIGDGTDAHRLKPMSSRYSRRSVWRCCARA